MSKDFDNLRKNYLNNDIPKEIDNNIHNILNNLPKENKKSKELIRKISATILVVVGTVALLTISSSDVRANIKSILKLITTDNNSSFREINKRSEAYSEDINYKIKTDNGEISINEAVFTPKSIVYTFTIDKSFFNTTDIKKVEKLLDSNILNISKVKVNNKEVEAKLISGFSKISQDESKVIGYGSIMLDGLSHGDNVELVIDKVASIDEAFNLLFNVDMKIKNNELFNLNDAIEKRSDECTINIEEVISTPMFTYMSYILEINNEFIDEYNYSVEIVNEAGRSLNRYQSTSEYREEIGNNKIRVNSFLENFNKDIKTIRFIPFKVKKEKEKNLYEFIRLDKNTPFDIDFGDLGKVTINSIKESSNKIILNLDVDGINKDSILININIAPSIVEEQQNSQGVIGGVNYIGMDKESYDSLNNINKINNITLSFDKDESFNGEYLLFYNLNLKKTKYLIELQAKVDLDYK